MAGYALPGGTRVVHGCRRERRGVVAGIALPGIGDVGRVLFFCARKDVRTVVTCGTLAGDTSHGVVYGCRGKRDEILVATVALRSRRQMVCRLGQALAPGNMAG